LKDIDLRKFVADFHIHTCLSPCADNDMTPPNILKRAEQCGLDILGICDHNSAENCESVVEAAHNHDITVFPGMEVTTSEEVHIISLFNSVSDALAMQETVEDNLDGENDEDAFGIQLIADKLGNYTGINNKLLIGATRLTVHEVVNKIHELNGIAIAAHIDRESFSIISQLGFIPEDLKLDGLEVTSRLAPDNRGSAGFHYPAQQEVVKQYPRYQDYTFICSSDAHFLDDFGKGRTEVMMCEPTLEEFHKALLQKGGRTVIMN